MSGVTINDEDWTISPKRYSGMNAGPSDVARLAYEEKAKESLKKVYETLDSGSREHYDSGMQRDPGEDKVRWDLVVPADHPTKGMLQRWAELMTRGAKKYEARNWELADSQKEYDRFRESLFRHFMMYWLGDDTEDHAAAIFFNIEGAEYVRERIRLQESSSRDS